jgi:hypothetical protein
MKILTIILSLVVCTTLNAQKGKIFISSWQENADEETNIPPDKYSFYEKGKYYYHISNNEDFIYLKIKVEDPGVQNRILKEGLTVWINMDSKSTKKMGIRYPVGTQNSSSRGGPNIPEVKLNPDGTIATPVSQANTIELIGFTNEDKRRFPSDNYDSFRGSVGYDKEGILQYKMVMPVEKLPVRNTKEGNGALPFTIGIEYGTVIVMKGPGGTLSSPQSLEPPPRGGGGGGRGGGGARPGGGSGTSSVGQTRTPVQTNHPAPTVILWVKNITLATDK